MGSSYYLFLFAISFFHLLIISNSSSSLQPTCHDHERSALLHFKQSFKINKKASDDPSAYPKINSWNLGGNSSDCCSWDGVECDENAGYVIGLDLSSSFLYGSINSKSSLFCLLHLQRLDLSDNNFNYSRIPSSIGRFSGLASLNLSRSIFSGKIPQEISELSNLISIDLSLNELLNLEKPTFRKIVQNLTRLEALFLSQVNISSEIPNELANSSSLRSLLLNECGLFGEFPLAVFHLPKLRTLNLKHNWNLGGHLPEFRQGSPLQDLRLAGTNFSGNLPDSIGNLKFLKALDLNNCSFMGSIPFSLGNLVQLFGLGLSYNYLTGPIPSSFNNLTQLTVLSLSSNNIKGNLISWIGNQNKLTFLGFYMNGFYDKIPSSMKNLTQLQTLVLYKNQLTGEIPHWLSNLTQLTLLDLSFNNFHGLVPESIFRITNINVFNLQFNNLSGVIDTSLFMHLKYLTQFQLSSNRLSLSSYTNFNASATLPKFQILGLGDCNLNGFPEFLRDQDELQWLELSGNNIGGRLPEWMLNMGKNSLLYFHASFNSLTGFEKLPSVLPWENLQSLDLNSNILRGSLPVPPPSTLIYDISNNSLTGKIPELFCDTRILYMLDLSKNNLSGKIPECLSSLSDSLMFLDLGGNNFVGGIPQSYTERCNLRSIDLSQNSLDGKVPRSLSNCTMLENLNLGNNQIEDTFPIMLGTLSELRILLLRSNKFHGVVKKLISNFDFPKLRIIDMSDNSFTGELPDNYFHNWNASRKSTNQSRYVQTETTYQSPGFVFVDNFTFSMRLRNKGLDTFYSVIQNVFSAIDLSSNKFTGEIPESIGNLKGVQLLNLSNNDLNGTIPSSIKNLNELEALDLSRNELSGAIPRDLTQLTFLGFLDVSENRLVGPIPRGRQFDTFDNRSYEGNVGLCGDPLSRKCGRMETLQPPPSSTDEDEDDKIRWMFVLAGSGSGLVVGWVIGMILTGRRHEWFVRTFGRRNKKLKFTKKH